MNLSVESSGFCIPDECEEAAAVNVCEYFEDLDFPMDIFAPPQKEEFFLGVHGDIPSLHKCKDKDKEKDKEKDKDSEFEKTK